MSDRLDRMGPSEVLAAIAAADVGLWRRDLAADRIILSPRAAELLGAKTASLSGADFLALVHGEDRPGMARGLAGLADTELDFDFRLAGDGAWRRMCGAVQPGGEHASGILLDIGIRRAAQQADSRLAAIVA